MNHTEAARPHALHIVHIISGLLHGGAETVLVRLLTAPTQTARHTVISMGGEGVFGPRLREQGVTVMTLEMQGVWGSLRGLWRLAGLLRQQRPDVVQTWMYHADLVGGVIARLLGIRAIAWGVRNSGVNLGDSSRQSRILAWLCARVSSWVPGVIVACAHKAADVHIGWGYRADRLLVAPNGYALDQWHPDAADRAQVRAELGLSAQTPLVGCVARWNPLKDHVSLLAALSLSVRAHPELRCLLIGRGMTRDNAALMAQVRQFGLLDHLIFMGRREDVPRLMRALDVHVLSSYAEGFPNVVSEAMASGVACVVTDVGDAARIVGDLGWIAPARDPLALSLAIDAALADLGSATWADRLAQGREAVAQRYSLETMVERYRVIWERLAQDYPRPWARAPAARACTTASTRPGIYGGIPSSQPGVLMFFINNPAFFMSHRLPLALAAQASGMTVHVVTMDGPAVAQILEHGLIHHSLPLSRSGMNPWAEVRSLYAFWRIVRRVRPDLVHAVTIKPVLYGGIACRLAGVPAFVAAISGLGYVFIRSGAGFNWLRWLTIQLYRRALGHRNSRVIFQNTSDRDVFIAARVIHAKQAVIIQGSGVDLERFSVHPLPTGPVVAVMASRLLRDKGVLEFVQAARLSATRQSGVCWRLAGSPDPGNPGSITEEELADWQRDGFIDYVGECEDVAALYAQAHIVVLPSYREGLPKSLIEAAACGRPVVTTDVPGCRDAIEPDTTGVLVPARQALMLADAVLGLAADEPRRLAMGAAGRALAERAFGLDHVVQEHLRIYKDLI
ncbi:glycosyltransferase [Alcaligenaceae bacterium CGII-47]|nr:glycosyltransferase [Alcaligenaceae bacterium CGII-47]